MSLVLELYRIWCVMGDQGLLSPCFYLACSLMYMLCLESYCGLWAKSLGREHDPWTGRGPDQKSQESHAQLNFATLQTSENHLPSLSFFICNTSPQQLATLAQDSMKIQSDCA